MTKSAKLFCMVIAFSAVSVLTINPTHASLSFVGSRATLAGTDFIEWGNLGPTFTNVSQPFNILSNLGVSVTVDKTQGGDFQRRDQGNGWAGNFANGDRLLWTQDFNDNFNTIGLMTFGGNGVSAVGTQIQTDNFGAFVASVEAFDQFNNSLGSFNVNGNSTSNGDNSAVFLGVSDNATAIFSVRFSIVSGPGNDADFAINQVDFTSSTGRVPEPGTLLIWSVFAGTGLVFSKRRRAVA